LISKKNNLETSFASAVRTGKFTQVCTQITRKYSKLCKISIFVAPGAGLLEEKPAIKTVILKVMTVTASTNIYGSLIKQKRDARSSLRETGQWIHTVLLKRNTTPDSPSPFLLLRYTSVKLALGHLHSISRPPHSKH